MCPSPVHADNRAGSSRIKDQGIWNLVDLNLTPAITVLTKYAASGVGAVAGLMLANWRASQEGKARITSALADKEVRRIEVESDVQALKIIAEAQAEAQRHLLAPNQGVVGTAEISRDDVTQRIEFQEQKRLANVRSVVEKAADDLGDKDIADHEPDPDWTARFFDSVQDVSSEDMRKIWAKILAGEVESPGRTSLRTLDTLRNMTKEDAEMFRNICGFVFDGSFLFYDDSVKSHEALAFGYVLHLQDCELIHTRAFLQRSLTWHSEEHQVLNHHGGFLLITRNRESVEKVDIPAIRLTSSGRELSRFVQPTLNMKYLQAFSTFLQSKDCELSSLDGVEELPGGGLRYATRTRIEPTSEQPEASPS